MYNGSISHFPEWVQILITIFVSLAFFEFIIFYIVFIFGLFKSCFKNKLTNKHGNIWLAIIAAIIFTLIRSLHIPMLLMNIPLPFKFPTWFIKLSIYFVTSVFIVLLLAPVFTMIFTKIITEKKKQEKKDTFEVNTVQRERNIINSVSAHDIINNNFGSSLSLNNLDKSNSGLNLYKPSSNNHVNVINFNNKSNEEHSSASRLNNLYKAPSTLNNYDEYSSTTRLNADNNQSSTRINITGSLSTIDIEPIVCIIMPIYNELLPILVDAIDRIVDSNYEKSKLHLYLSFDDDTESFLYIKLMSCLGAQKYRISEDYKGPELGQSSIRIENHVVESDHYSYNEGGYPPIFNMVYRGVKCTVIRNKHEGKRMTQANTFNAIKHTYEDFVLTSTNNIALTVLFIDSDVLIDSNAIKEFVNCFKDGRMAVTGLITCATSSDNKNFWWLLQDLEYVQGQMMDRCLESFLGGVTCLPGALTMVEFNTLKEVEDEYFKSSNFIKNMSIIDYARFHLGEDRYLTHLFMDSLPYPNAIGFCPTAVCKTEAPKRLSVLLKQRRRWILGTYANEIYMFTDPVLWKSRPLLMLLRFTHNCTRSISLLLYIFIISVIAGIFSKDGMVIETPIILIAIILPLITNWIYMIYFGLTLHRYKTLLYPVMYLVHPFFSWLCFVYTIFTFNKRTWGGPRTISNPTTNSTEKTKSMLSSGNRSSGMSKLSDESDDDRFENEIFNMYSEEYNKTIYLSEVDKNTLYNAYGGRKREKDIETIVNRINSPNRNSRNRLSEIFKFEKGNSTNHSMVTSPVSVNSQTSYTDTIIPSKMNNITNSEISNQGTIIANSINVYPINSDVNSIHGTIVANKPKRQPYYRLYYGKGKERYDLDYSNTNSISTDSTISPTSPNKHDSDTKTIFNS
ncbi:hypothetical protein BCR36DRAFT_412422 [Piromyces finnis]|uniref:chitin synthase n=1 Tax=Piromyces finnis TaxID=1754191 RepID=A0A1Y1V9L8_9FUNG|nr:hypothetical protein BCR36DRAFT_412422 [Piromyces finnis]|eukprot:ORX50400.1 hypothetical protein BCR36DRAFT_412422 [Piromyces finnis]